MRLLRLPLSQTLEDMKKVDIVIANAGVPGWVPDT